MHTCQQEPGTIARFNSQQDHQDCVEVRNVSRVPAIQVRKGIVYTTSILYQHTQHEQWHGGFETQCLVTNPSCKVCRMPVSCKTSARTLLPTSFTSVEPYCPSMTAVILHVLPCSVAVAADIIQVIRNYTTCIYVLAKSVCSTSHTTGVLCCELPDMAAMLAKFIRLFPGSMPGNTIQACTKSPPQKFPADTTELHLHAVQQEH